MKKIIGGMLIVLCIGLLASTAFGKATVSRDKYGIPSIQADTEEELFEEFGYVTAVDRLWQMEVHRRMGRATFAQIFGPKLVPADTQSRLNGYTEGEYLTIFEKIPADFQKLLKAYINGINRRVDELTADPKLLPMEYLALKIKPDHFTVVDMLSFLTALYRPFGIVGGGELKNLAALETLNKRFGKREGWEVFNDWCWINDPAAPTYISGKTTNDHVPGDPKLAEIPAYLDQTEDVVAAASENVKLNELAFNEARRIGAPVKGGSYAWTLSPQVTGTGFPILVGQVQALQGNVPSVVAEIQLKGGRFNVVGGHVPLLPFILVGHNHDLAWSIMVGMSDNADIYQEVLNPLNKEEYLFRGAWRKMDKRTEKITVAGGQVKEITVYRTVHGPVFSPFPFDPLKSDAERVYTKKISWWQTEAMFAEGLFRINIAANSDEFGTAMAMHAPTVHYAYADIKGNIGYWHNGFNPERPDGFDPRLPLPGTGQAEWTGRYLPSAHAINPAKGFVAGWNQKASPDTRNPFHSDYNYHFGRYHRALWLERAISGRSDLDLEANLELMRHVGGAGEFFLNHHNAFGYTCRELVPFIARSINKAPEDRREQLNRVLTVLASWDGRSVADVVKDEQFQAGHTIYRDWLPRLIRATFSDEFDGIEDFKSIKNRIFNLFLRCLDGPTSTLPVSRNYFDDIRTQPEESLEDIFLQTLVESVAQLQTTFENDDPAAWKGPRAKITFKHAMFGKVAEMWENNIGTVIFIVELRPEGAVGYSRFPLGQSGNISAGADKKPVFDPHFFDMQPLYQGYTHQKMGTD